MLDWWCLVGVLDVGGSQALLTNRVRGPYWGMLARGRGSKDLAALGLYKNDLGPIFPVRLQLARLVSTLLYHSGHACFEFSDFRKQKIHSLWPFPWKRFVWPNPYHERTNQNTRIYLKNTLPYNKSCYCHYRQRFDIKRRRKGLLCSDPFTSFEWSIWPQIQRQ